MGISSTNTSGSPDLDTRPSEMMRSTICYWIERCPSCGYSSSSLSECDGDVRGFVESKAYQDILENKSIPEIAASFMASSYIKQEQQKYSESAWSAIRAAWICDDKNNYEASSKCRRKSISLMERAKEKGQVVMDQVGASEAITIDLMRRAGMFQEALNLVNETKRMDIEEVIGKVVSYQEKLVRSKDTDSHTISEALGEE